MCHCTTGTTPDSCAQESGHVAWAIRTKQTKKPIKSNSNKKNYGTNNPDAQAEKMAIKKSVQSGQAKYSNSNKDSLQEKISIKKR